MAKKKETDYLRHYKPAKIIQGFRGKFIDDPDKLKKLADGLKAAGHKIVVTIGTFDAIHVGHVRYLESAASHGDVLIVGIDSDNTVNTYKQRNPLISFGERWEMLTHLRSVDYVVPIEDVTPIINDDGKKTGRWEYELLKIVKPDVFIAVTDSYRTPQLGDISRYVGEIIVLERHAETSTSAIIRKKMLEEADAKAQKNGNKKVTAKKRPGRPKKPVSAKKGGKKK